MHSMSVLYPLEDTIRSLLELRRVARPGAQMLLETSVWNMEKEPMARFNSDMGIYNDETTYWSPNFPCLLAWLRLAGWEPFLSTNLNVSAHTSYRSCMICKATKPIGLTQRIEPYNF